MAFQPTEHPVLALPSQERMREFKKRGKKGLDELVEIFKKREELIIKPTPKNQKEQL